MSDSGIDRLRDFSIARYEVVLEAGEQGLVLPPYKGSTLRGGFGRVFRRICCAQRQDTCRGCMLREACPYAYVFETAPPPGAEVLHNLEAVPRPFVIEPPLETRCEYNPGEKLTFGLVLIGRAVNYLPYFIVSFDELGRVGLGKHRRPCILREVRALDLDGNASTIFRADDRTVRPAASISGEQLLACARKVGGDPLLLRFLTPTRLKHQEHWIHRPAFHVLVRGLLRRLSSLTYFHHGWEWQADYAGLIERAATVGIASSDTRWVDWERYSARQDARIALGGFVGSVAYEGDISEFMSLLLLGEHVHVGKGAVFGLGWYKIEHGIE